MVIINLGTNDGNTATDVPNIGIRMNNVLNALWNAPDMSNTCIFLSTLIPTNNEVGMLQRDSINSQYRALVNTRASEGKCIYLADMDPNGAVWLTWPDDYWSAEVIHVHPNVSPFYLLSFRKTDLMDDSGLRPQENGCHFLSVYSQGDL